MGSKHHEVTEKAKNEIIALKSFGVTNEEIADYLDISVDTLTRHYKYELKIARIRANAEVCAKLYKKAVKDEDLGAIIFWIKCRANWKTEDSLLHTEANKELAQELQALREKLDARNRKDY